MTDPTDVLIEFFDEFQDRLDSLTSKAGKKGVNKDLLFLLVENLVLKYENRMQQSQHGLLAKLIPFLRKSGYDTDFEANINAELEKLDQAEPYVWNKPGEMKLNGKIASSFQQVLRANRSNTNLPTPIVDNIMLNEEIQHKDVKNEFSKTNIPPAFDIALQLSPLPGKGQDHIDFFVIDEHRVGVILCDGVSGDGPDSTIMAQTIPKALSAFIKTYFYEEFGLREWQDLITTGLNRIVDAFTIEQGSSTVLVAVVDKSAELTYIAWMGDGHLIYFNEHLTGFSKLLTSHQNSTGQLTKVVTAKGLIGKPSVQIVSTTGGAIILSSDGYNLSNGRILRHLFQEVLRGKVMHKALENWSVGCCEDIRLHPAASDDRSIGVIRWGVEA